MPAFAGMTKTVKLYMLINVNNPICAVIVTYHPDIEVLLTLIKSLKDQVQQIIIVDNSEAGELEKNIKTKISDTPLEILTLNQNIGVAAAHNRGIDWAKQNNFEYVVLFDQDSCPSSTMISELIGKYFELIGKGCKIAAVGPCLVDIQTSLNIPFNKLSECKMKKIVSSEKNEEYCQTSFLITSGSLLSIGVYNKVGFFDESLFIDYVDVEWGLRALSKGYDCYGVFTAMLYHRLGDEMINVMGIRVPQRAPLRQYYLIRNAISLYRRKYLPLCWKINDAVRLLVKYFMYAFIISPRRENLQMMLLGFWHGLRGLSGKF